MVSSSGGEVKPPTPDVPDVPSVKPPGGTGSFTCPFSCYRLDAIIEAGKDGVPDLYEQGPEVTVTFDYAVEDFLGNVDWRNWDDRLSPYDIGRLRRCRGNGYVDLDATAMQSDSYVLSGKYRVRKGLPPGIFSSPRYYLEVQDGAWVDLAAVTAYRSHGMVIGFWVDSKSPQIPTDFTRFDSTKCPVQTVIVIPSID